jgi:hypothetical protein
MILSTYTAGTTMTKGGTTSIKRAADRAGEAR